MVKNNKSPNPKNLHEKHMVGKLNVSVSRRTKKFKVVDATAVAMAIAMASVAPDDILQYLCECSGSFVELRKSTIHFVRTGCTSGNSRAYAT